MDRTALRQTLVELLENCVGEKVGHLDDAQDLREGLHLDSVDLVTLVIEIQSKFSIQIASEELNQLVRVGDVLDLIQAKTAPKPSAA
jgi:acyl carrier protein